MHTHSVHQPKHSCIVALNNWWIIFHLPRKEKSRQIYAFHGMFDRCLFLTIECFFSPRQWIIRTWKKNRQSGYERGNSAFSRENTSSVLLFVYVLFFFLFRLKGRVCAEKRRPWLWCSRLPILNTARTRECCETTRYVNEVREAKSERRRWGTTGIQG